MGKLVTAEEADAIMKFWRVMLVGYSLLALLAWALGFLTFKMLLGWQNWIFPAIIATTGILRKRIPALVYIPFVIFLLFAAERAFQIQP